MNWIIEQSPRFTFHTDLKSLIIPIRDDIKNLNWLISDLEFRSSDPVPLDHDKKYFILSSEEFNTLIQADMQIIWGVLSGIPAAQQIEIDEHDLPYADGNASIWTNYNMQQQQAVIEIICFDSSFTIVSFKNTDWSTKFKNYFDEAIELEKF